MTEPFEPATDYAKFRGKCKELYDTACSNDSSLTLTRGFYYCPVWNTEEQHWWTVRKDGTIYDPSAKQFPSNGYGIYTPFIGIISCSQCGKEMKEEDADIQGNYAFCSGVCYGKFVGVL